MPRRIFNDEKKELVRQWVAENVPAPEIAARIGCTLSTLKVKCSHYRISLRTPNWKERSRATREANYTAEEMAAKLVERNALPKNAPIARAVPVVAPPLAPEPKPTKTRETFKMESSLAISRVAMSLLRQYAEAQGKSDAQLASELLETIAKDGLFDMVLRRAA